MLAFLQGKVSERKLRLFGCACCRRMEHLLDDRVVAEAIAAAEACADGRTDAQEMTWVAQSLQPIASAVERMYWPGQKGLPSERDSSGDAIGRERPLAVARLALLDAIWTVAGPSAARALTAGRQTIRARAALAEAESVGGLDAWSAWRAAETAEAIAQCGLVRDLLGNPFRSVSSIALDRIEAVGGLAQSIYEHRRFAEMPALADALEQAGCRETEILTHCRQEKEHARGCWVLDLILGKG
jgi:hypothetical protein